MPKNSRDKKKRFFDDFGDDGEVVDDGPGFVASNMESNFTLTGDSAKRFHEIMSKPKPKPKRKKKVVPEEENESSPPLTQKQKEIAKTVDVHKKLTPENIHEFRGKAFDFVTDESEPEIISPHEIATIRDKEGDIKGYTKVSPDAPDVVFDDSEFIDPQTIQANSTVISRINALEEFLRNEVLTPYLAMHDLNLLPIHEIKSFLLEHSERTEASRNVKYEADATRQIGGPNGIKFRLKDVGNSFYPLIQYLLENRKLIK